MTSSQLHLRHHIEEECPWCCAEANQGDVAHPLLRPGSVGNGIRHHTRIATKLDAPMRRQCQIQIRLEENQEVGSKFSKQ